MGLKFQVINSNDEYIKPAEANRLVGRGWARLVPLNGRMCVEYTKEHPLKRIWAEREENSNFNSRSVRQIGNSNRRGRAYRVPATGPTAEELHWRESVLVRDDYKCVFCGSKENLEADHIKPKSVFPHLKYEVSNGRTLCGPCHRKTDTYGRRSHGIIEVTEADAS